MACRLCEGLGLDGEALAQYLEEYVSSLPQDIRADGALYARRLAECEVCEKRVALTCRECGCYVQARAAKAKLRCPRVPPRW